VTAFVKWPIIKSIADDHQTMTAPFPALLVAGCAAMLGQGMVVPLLPVYARSLGASGLMVGAIFGGLAFARTLCMPFSGYLSDDHGRKPFIAAGLLLYFGVALAYAGFPQIYSLIAIRLLQGVAAAMVLPTVQAYVGDLSSRGSEGRFMGRLNASLALGLCGGPIIGGFLKDAFGLNAAFAGMGIVCLVGCLTALRGLPPSRSEASRCRPQAVTTSGGRMRHDRDLIGLWLYRFMYCMCLGTVWAFTPLMAHNRFQLASFTIGTIITTGMVATTLMAPLAGSLADWVSKRTLIIGGGLLSTGGMVVLTQLTHPRDFYTASLLMGLGGGLAGPATAALAAIIGRRHNAQGRIMGWLGTSESSGLLVGPLLAGLVVDTWGYPAAFGAGVGLAAISIVPVLWFSSDRRRA
jgi:MFS family permease